MKTDDICKEAYYLWESQGRPHGRDQEFWYQAELLIQSRLTPSLPPPAPVGPARQSRPAKVAALAAKPVETKVVPVAKPAPAPAASAVKARKPVRVAR